MPQSLHPPLPDDSTLESLPQGQVDYLSHVWKEEDVWRSWRNMTRQKNAIANGTRLENASWRTWWKQRNKLKTVSPETLNWLKDSDVTWLYGPLHSAVDAVPPPKVSTTEERLGLVGATRIKPILKHRSILETLTNHMPTAPLMDGYIEFDYDAADGANSYFPALEAPSPSHPYSLPRTKSDTNLLKYHIPRGPQHSPVGGPQMPPGHSSVSHTPAHSPNRTPPSRGRSTEGPRTSAADGEGPGRRHISFNTFVEQCIAIDKPSGSRSEEGISEEDEDVDSEDDVLEFRSKHSSKQTLARTNSQSSERGHVTIAPIAPTMLKSVETFATGPSVVYLPPSGSQYSTTPPIHFQLDEHVPFQSAMASRASSLRASATAYPRAGTVPPVEDDDPPSGDSDLNATPDLGLGDQFGGRGRREAGTSSRYSLPAAETTAVNGRRNHHRSSPSPDLNAAARPAVSNAQRTSPSSDLLSADSHFARERTGSSSPLGPGSYGDSAQSRGRSSIRGSSSSLNSSRSGSRNRIDSSSPIGSISPNSSRSGSSHVVRRGSSDLIAAAGELRKGSASSSPPIVVPSPKTSPPSRSPPAAAAGAMSPSASTQPTLKQALKAKEPIFVRPSLVINHDALSSAGRASSSAESGNDPPSPLLPSDAEARKLDDYWADTSADGKLPTEARAMPSALQAVKSSHTRAASHDESGLVGRAVDIVSERARGMFRGIFQNARE